MESTMLRIPVQNVCGFARYSNRDCIWINGAT